MSAYPGAQLSFTDHDAHRFQAVLTDQPDPDIQTLERRYRQRARCEEPHPQRQRQPLEGLYLKRDVRTPVPTDSPRPA